MDSKTLRALEKEDNKITARMIRASMAEAPEQQEKQERHVKSLRFKGNKKKPPTRNKHRR